MYTCSPAREKSNVFKICPERCHLYRKKVCAEPVSTAGVGGDGEEGWRAGGEGGTEAAYPSPPAALPCASLSCVEPPPQVRPCCSGLSHVGGSAGTRRGPARGRPPPAGPPRPWATGIVARSGVPATARDPAAALGREPVAPACSVTELLPPHAQNTVTQGLSRNSVSDRILVTGPAASTQGRTRSRAGGPRGPPGHHPTAGKRAARPVHLPHPRRPAGGPETSAASRQTARRSWGPPTQAQPPKQRTLARAAACPCLLPGGTGIHRQEQGWAGRVIGTWWPSQTHVRAGERCAHRRHSGS